MLKKCWKKILETQKRKKPVGKCLDSFKVQMENSRKIKKKKTEVLKSLDSFKVWIVNSRNTNKNRSPEKFEFLEVVNGKF